MGQKLICSSRAVYLAAAGMEAGVDTLELFRSKIIKAKSNISTLTETVYKPLQMETCRLIVSIIFQYRRFHFWPAWVLSFWSNYRFFFTPLPFNMHKANFY